MWRDLVTAALVGVASVGSVGAIFADHDCQDQSMCGTGSERCFYGAQACTYCDGTDPARMCVIVQYSTCTSNANLECGNTWWGHCIGVYGEFRGNCRMGVYYGPGCRVPGCL